jgi:hypothetical protein
MRIVIIKPTNTVRKADISYEGLDLSSCGLPDNLWALQWSGSSGHIEYDSPMIQNDPITELPAWANACIAVWEAKDYAVNNPPAPTPEEVIALNKSEAKRFLDESDWAVLPDVPLQNKSEWETYRAALREIATNPTIDPVWPVKPQSVWS